MIFAQRCYCSWVNCNFWDSAYAELSFDASLQFFPVLVHKRSLNKLINLYIVVKKNS